MRGSYYALYTYESLLDRIIKLRTILTAQN